jgi:ActR/RegA family two-component response regulator
MVDGPAAKPKLLLVDDDRLILFTLAEALGAMGFDVISASTGEAALKLARESNPELACWLVTCANRRGCRLFFSPPTATTKKASGWQANTARLAIS